jgi:hypothetical protein
MPVIIYVPPDPTDFVIQGESFRSEAVLQPINNVISPFLAYSGEPLNSIIVAGLQDYPPMQPAFAVRHARLRSPFDGSMIGANAVICTPCGAVYPVDIGNHLMDEYVGATSRWQITGVTRDNAGATLGNCRVVMLEVSRIAVGETPVVAETISDGSGNYTIEVALNTAHQGIAYKDGSPDVAGISIDTLTPAQV